MLHGEGWGNINLITGLGRMKDKQQLLQGWEEGIK